MGGRRWRVRQSPASLPQDLVERAGNCGHLGALLLHHRAIRDGQSAARFLKPELAHLTDPLALPDMYHAVERVATALDRRERIGVLGDFDVDGLTGAAILVQALRDLGGNVSVHIPDRAADGHGLTTGAVDAFHDDGVGLIVTADTGSTAAKEITYARWRGIDTVVTDHHLSDSLPADALAVVNPHRAGALPESSVLSGAGVAFRLAQAISEKSGRAPASHLVSLAALGVIADVAPLTGDNRIIAAEGLRELQHTSHPGLRALLDQARAGNRGARAPIDTEAIAFHIGPRLNAPGRLGSPLLSLQLLTSSNDAEAKRLAEEIENLNGERQRLSREAWALAEAQLAKLPALPPVLTIVSPDLMPGILGPLAGRLCGEYERPAIAVQIENGNARASARSIPGFDIHDAIARQSARLTRYGGHARAAGFSCAAPDLEGVLADIASIASSCGPVTAPPFITADVEVGLAELGASAWDFVQMLAPCGEGNPSPLFFTRGMLPMQIKTLGATGDHLRLVLDGGARKYDAIGFGLGGADLGSSLVDAIYALRTDHWNGRVRHELELKAIRPAAQA
ncbi:MAG: single-stranded-DNA-specific exonuclease RecJ [SAR202 cluster bacterium]|nr:single-stranded-DNA-specific exonuclease RecJ [SAR202 cluster bacterium]